ncbi:MAG: hypothetical protein ACUVXD_18690, partial [Thermodesulfobacteriota bacterium]
LDAKRERERRDRSMMPLVGGIVATVIGAVLLVVWWKFFVWLLAGAVPAILILGGALAIYIGIDELKDKMQQSKES